MKSKGYLSKKEISLIFQKFKINKLQQPLLKIKIVEEKDSGKKDYKEVWLIADSTSRFNSFNLKKYGELESNIG